MLYCLFFYEENSSSSLFSSIGLYGLAFFRLMPALNRMVTAYSYKNILMHTINKLYEIDNNSKLEKSVILQDVKKNQFGIENIKVENVSFSYNDKKI